MSIQFDFDYILKNFQEKTIQYEISKMFKLIFILNMQKKKGCMYALILKLNVMEIKCLRSRCGVTIKRGIRNKEIRRI